MQKSAPQKLFFCYAFPCTEVILQKGNITQKRFEELKEYAENGTVPSKEILENTYKTAFENLKKIAEKQGKDYWDESVIREYFEGQGHNEFINSGGGEFGHAPESMKDMCRIIEGKVEETDCTVCRVRYGGKTRICRNIYNIDLKRGDKVVIHYGYIMRKV